MGNDGSRGVEIDKRDATIIAACRRTVELYERRALGTAGYITRSLNAVEGVESAPVSRLIPADALAAVDRIIGTAEVLRDVDVKRGSMQPDDPFYKDLNIVREWIDS